MGTGRFHSPRVEATNADDDECGGAGDAALCGSDSVVRMVAGAISLRDGSSATLFSRAAVAILSRGHGAIDHLRHSSSGGGESVFLRFDWSSVGGGVGDGAVACIGWRGSVVGGVCCAGGGGDADSRRQEPGGRKQPARYRRRF